MFLSAFAPENLVSYRDVLGWRTTGSVCNLLGIIVVSPFQRIGLQPEKHER